MINEVLTVRDRCFAHTNGLSPSLETVTNVFNAYSKIDKILFVKYKVSVDNPIIGQFLKWEQLVPYSSPETCVEVRYADHLERNEALKRIVVVKEICHALDSRKGTHSTKESAIDNLAASFALSSASQLVSNISNHFAAEILAEIAAYEILFPSTHRKGLIDSGEYDAIGASGVAKKYQIPEEHIDTMFTPTFLKTTLNMFP